MTIEKFRNLPIAHQNRFVRDTWGGNITADYVIAAYLERPDTPEKEADFDLIFSQWLEKLRKEREELTGIISYYVL